MTDLAVIKAEGSPAPQLERAGTLDIGAPLRERLPLEPLAGVTLERDDLDNGIALMLRQGPSCPTPVGTLNAVWDSLHRARHATRAEHPACGRSVRAMPLGFPAS